MKGVGADSDRRGRKSVEDLLEENAAIFEPFIDGLCEAVRRGGRLLLFGEGRLHLLAELAAPEIVGRRHRNGLRLPADALDPGTGDPAAIARRVGPFDAILALCGACEDPLFAGALEAARARGARIFCLCLARGARVEGRVTLAVDVPESRPHHIPGHLSLILNFLSKRALAKLGSNPFVRPTRLDDGPARPAAAAGAPLSASASGRHPAAGAPGIPGPGARSGALPGAPLEEQPTPPPPGILHRRPGAEPGGPVEDPTVEIDLEESGIRFPRGVPAPSGAGDGRRAWIQFRCKECREPVIAEPHEAGERGRCPFCGARLKVPRSAGRVYHPAAQMLSQAGRPVSLKFSLAECRLAIAPAGREPLDATVEDVSEGGIEASLPVAEAGALPLGGEVELRLEAPAFLEPLVATATVERVISPGQRPESGSGGRSRALLPLAEGAPREVRRKLGRLADLAAGAGGALAGLHPTDDGEGKTGNGRR